VSFSALTLESWRIALFDRLGLHEDWRVGWGGMLLASQHPVLVNQYKPPQGIQNSNN